MIKVVSFMEVFDPLLRWPSRVLFTFGAWFQIIKKSLENIWLGYIWYNWIFDRFEWKMDIININNIFGFGIIRLHYYFMRMLDVSYLYDESSCSTKVFWSMFMPSRFRSTSVNHHWPKIWMNSAEFYLTISPYETSRNSL